MVKRTESAGAPHLGLDGLRAELAKNRAQFYKEITLPSMDTTGLGAKISEGIRSTGGCRACWEE